MKYRKVIISVIAVLLAAVMVLGVVVSVLPQSANAASSSAIGQQLNELKKKKKEIDSQIAGLESQKKANLNEMQAIVDQKNLIDQQIFMLHEQVNNINEQISTISVMIGDKEAELADAQARLEELNKKNKERIRTMEEDGELSYWSVLFKAHNFSDLLDQLNMITEIAAADRRRLKEISEVAEEIARVKEELGTQKLALEDSKAELAESQKVLEEKRAEADKLLADLIARGEEFQQLLDVAELDAAALGSDIKDVQNQYDAAKRAEWLATSVPTPASGGGSDAPASSAKWLRPTNYVRVSSPYGWRTHPIYGDYRFHYGVDLSASSGTPIYASRGGRVTIATYSSSGGYYVEINHGDGFSSRYLHMTHYIVSVGQTVSAGQVIGYVGSTGASTGPHLHFSVLYNGNYVNPSAYIGC